MLVDISPPDYDVDLEIAYATDANFTGAPVYARPGCYLLDTAVPLLQRAIDLAARQNLRFRIYDAFRPSEAQWALWRHTPDPDFLSDPRAGSPHTRGVALDLTLIDGNGKALDMGTGFDAFTPLSYHGDTEISAAAQANRYLLLGIMTAAGWEYYSHEWWHYQLHDADRYPLLSDADLPSPMMPPEASAGA